MQERHLYEYATIRFVPKVEREEFINVGIVLFSKRCKYLKSLYTIDENKLKLFSSELDMNCLKEGLHVFDRICSGSKEGGNDSKHGCPRSFPVADRCKKLMYTSIPPASRIFRGFGCYLGAFVQRISALNDQSWNLSR